MSNNLFVVYSKRVAFTLREQGFSIITVGVNKNFPQFDTYLFEDSQELRAAMQALSKANNN